MLTFPLAGAGATIYMTYRGSGWRSVTKFACCHVKVNEVDPFADWVAIWYVLHAAILHGSHGQEVELICRFLLSDWLG